MSNEVTAANYEEKYLEVRGMLYMLSIATNDGRLLSILNRNDDTALQQWLGEKSKQTKELEEKIRSKVQDFVAELDVSGKVSLVVVGDGSDRYSELSETLSKVIEFAQDAGYSENLPTVVLMERVGKPLHVSHISLKDWLQY